MPTKKLIILNKEKKVVELTKQGSSGASYYASQSLHIKLQNLNYSKHPDQFCKIVSKTIVTKLVILSQLYVLNNPTETL